jgi:hypothetical protein
MIFVTSPLVASCPCRCRTARSMRHCQPPCVAYLHSSKQSPHYMSMFQVFQMFHPMLRLFHLDVAKVDQNIAHVIALYTYVSNVCSKCLISFSKRMFASVLSGYCICFHAYKVFFQVFQLFHTYVASISSGCYKSKYGIAASVSDACFMCFICLQTYVVNVVFECFKSRSSVASLFSLFCCLTFALVFLLLTSALACAAPSLSFGCWCSHLLPLVHARRGVNVDSPRAVGRRGPV